MPLCFALLLFLNACAVVRAPQTVKIALFAPFEGRYREIGYSALYAARLALAEERGFNNVDTHIELIPIDDGGTQAANHARALAQDPLIMAVIVLGYDGTRPEVLRAFGDLPVLVVGEWGAQPVTNNVFILSNPEIAQQITTPPRISVTDAAELPTPVVGSDVFALEGFRELRDSLDGVTVMSSGTLPDADFTVRYKGNDPFAPEPGLLATLTYNMTLIIRIDARLKNMLGLEGRMTLPIVFSGLGFDIFFENGYWAGAPIHRYHYEDGVLTEDTVE